MSAIMRVMSEPPLPDVEASDVHLCVYLEQMGMCRATEMGVSALSWVDLDSWCRLSQTTVTPGDASLLLMMSRAFVSGSRSEDAPFLPRECAVMVASGTAVEEFSLG